MARVFCVGGAINRWRNHTGSKFLSDALLDLVSGRSSSWQSAHVQVGGVV